MDIISWDLLSRVWDYAVPFLLILTVLVFVHELGHYLVARRNGVYVETFSIGFGPEIFGWNDAAGTRWKVSVVPLGGYIRMFGDEDATSRPSADLDTMSPVDREKSFYYKSLGQRSAIVFAGPLANFIFAIAVLVIMFMTIGQPFSSPRITEVLPQSAAEAAGLAEGDLITSLDGDEIERFEDIVMIVSQNPDRSMEVTVDREGGVHTFMVTPALEEGVDRFGNAYRVGRLGIRGTMREYVQHGPLTAVYRSVETTYTIVTSTLKAVGQMIAGTRSADELGGPLRIAQMSGEVAQYGISTIFWFMAVLSINLGLINLFPVPLLDGGHLLYFAAEAVRGKPIGERAQEVGFQIGLVMVLSLMIFATWNDLSQMGFFKFLQGLAG